MQTHWIQKTKQDHSIEAVAFQLTLKNKGKTWGPCPACGEEKRGNHDNRLPIGFYKSSDCEKWQCFSCNARGDVIDLVAYKLHGVKASQLTDYSEIKQFFSVHTFTDVRVVTKEKSALPEEEIKTLWKTVSQNCIADCVRVDIDSYLNGRAIAPAQCEEAFHFPNNFHYQSLQKVLTSSGRMMPWWPFKWANEYPICVPLFDANAKLCSFQGRAVRDVKPKTMCPAGFSMDGLFFANEPMRKFLKGEQSYPRFWIVEGEMDFLCLDEKTRTSPYPDDQPIMGIKNGSFSAYQYIRYPINAEIIIATDNDTKGNEYATRIASLINVVPKRLVLDGMDLNDFYMQEETKYYQDLVKHIQPFPDYDLVVAERALSLLKTTFYNIENLGRSERQNAIHELFKNIEPIAIAFFKQNEEAEKWFFRLSTLHGCGGICNKLLAAVNARVKGFQAQQTNEILLSSPSNMAEIEGPDETVELMRKEIKEKGVVVGYGAIKAIEMNLISILTNDRRLKGRLKYNDFTGTVEVDGEPIGNNEVMKISIWIQKHYEGFRMEPTLIGKCMNYVAAQPSNTYHPVQDVLNDWWKNVDLCEAPEHARPENLFTYYFRAENNSSEREGSIDLSRLNSEYGKMFCLCFVKRQLEPGCKSDYMMIAIGPQNAGKSIGIEALAIDTKYFSRGHLDLKSKDSKMVIKGCSLYELDECYTLIHHGFAQVKGFLTASEFRIRKPYDAHVSRLPVSCVLAGATNEQNLEFLADPSGSRRYMSMLVGVDGPIRVDELKNDLKYIYARAMHSYYGTGEYVDQGPNQKNWFDFNSDISKMQQRNNSRFAATDPWIPYISAHCRNQWENWNANRLNIVESKRQKLLYVSVKQILDEVLQVPPMMQNRKSAKRVAEVLIQIGLQPIGQRWHGKKKVAVWSIPQDLYKEEE